jgi:ribonuclease BN (tRNA processing enzyme)
VSAAATTPPTVRYTCVGSGTVVPRAERGPACHLLEFSGLRLLLDLGSGSLRSLARLGCEPLQLHAIGLTHKHMDHVADLLPLFFALRYAPGLQRDDPLRVFGYPGLRRDLERLAEVHGPWVMRPGLELVLEELAPGEELEISVGEARARIVAHPVHHTPEAVGFRVTLPDRGVEFAYSGDSGATDSLVELARDADLFVCECAFPDAYRVEGHLSPSEFLTICAAAAPRQVVATHLYPVWDELGSDRIWHEAFQKFGRKLDVITARDGLIVDLAGTASARRLDLYPATSGPNEPE